MRMMSSLKGIASTVTPWAVILLLIYLALFTHPAVNSNVVIPPPISVLDRFYGRADVKTRLPEIEEAVMEGRMTAVKGAQELLQ